MPPVFCNNCGAKKIHKKNSAISLYLCPNCNPEMFDRGERYV